MIYPGQSDLKFIDWVATRKVVIVQTGELSARIDPTREATCLWSRPSPSLVFEAYLAKHLSSIVPPLAVSSESVQPRSSTDEDWEAVFGVEGDPALLPGQTHHREQELDTFMEDNIDIRGYESKPLTW